MRFELRITGFGGQGVVTAGRLLALTVMKTNQNINVIYVPSYGFATRGGDALSDVILDEQAINYPKILGLDILVALSQSAFNASADLVKDNGLIITDADVVNDTSKLKSGIKIFKLKVSEVVRSIGSSIFTSIVMLGVLSVQMPEVINENYLISVLEANFPKKYLDQNLKAITAGKSLGAKLK
ncbi:MAG: 2-oxoacid:acceptor oxidoreductase family protein [Conexivisphaerales archaeon]